MRKRIHKSRKETTKIKARKKRKTDFAKIDNTKDIDLILEKNKIVQDLLGISRQKIAALFGQAVALMDDARFDEAISAFSLLTRINPYVADFWLGLGIAHFNSEDYERALEAMNMAQALDPHRVDIYVYAIDSCLQMHKTKQAEAILRQAVRYAKKQPHDDDAKLILEEADSIWEKIQDAKV